VSVKVIGPPDKLRIPYEEWEWGRFNHVGRGADGRQFLGFVTGAFPDGYDWHRVRDPNNNDWQRDKAWLAVLHQFDAEANHLNSEVRLGGYDSEGWEVAGDKARAELANMLGNLGPQTVSGDIYVKPFSVVINGVTHGLFYSRFAEGDFECESVMLEPRDIMFHPPWDSGEYST
jgi:hypothetical protein